MSDLRKAAQQALEYLDAPSAKLWPAGEQHRIIIALRAALAQPEPEPVAYTDDVTRIMREAGMTFHLGHPHKAVIEQMTRVFDLVCAEASIKAAQKFAVALAQPEQDLQLVANFLKEYGLEALDVIAALKAQPEPEPVCDKDPRGCWNVRCQLGKVCKNTPPQRKPLTEEEIENLGPLSFTWRDMVQFTRAIERAHGIE